MFKPYWLNFRHLLSFLINNLYKLEYYMLHFPTFTNTELIKMNVNYHSGRFTNIIYYLNLFSEDYLKKKTEKCECLT